MTTTHEVVAALGPVLARRIGEPRYRLWFADNTKFTWDGTELKIGVPNRFYQEWLQNTFTPAVEQSALEVFCQPAQVRFVIDPELFQVRRKQEEPQAITPSLPAGSKEVARPAVPARRWLQLEDFVPGPCSRLAHAAALHLVERPNQAPNPLTLHGPVGVGKTHLLEGIYAALTGTTGVTPVPLSNDEQLVFVAAEDFTNRFLQAMRESKLGPFRRRFRETQALLVDDVHFFANKHATQEEFLHTFDTLKHRGRPVAVTSECHPKLIPSLMPELVDRLLGGVVWSMEPPDLETRVAIVARKAQALGCALPPDVSQFLAEQVCSNVRELEGALHSVHHYSLAHGRPVTLELAREAVADLLRHTTSALQLRDIERALCHVLGLEGRVLHSKGRARAISHPRMVAMYLARKHTGAAYSEIGRFFGGRNHSTAIAADNKIRQSIDDDALLLIGEQRWRLRDLIERVERELAR